MTSRYRGSKISGSQQPFLTEMVISIVERWKRSMDYVLHAEESHSCQFFRFLQPYLQDNGLLRSWNFATIEKLNALRLWLVPSPLSALRSRASRRAGVGGKEERKKDWDWKMDRVFSSSSFLATPVPAIVRITKMTGEESALWPTETLWLPHGP